MMRPHWFADEMRWHLSWMGLTVEWWWNTTCPWTVHYGGQVLMSISVGHVEFWIGDAAP